MSEKAQKNSRLGRGLGQLIAQGGTNSKKSPKAAEGFIEIPIHAVAFNPAQPRKEISQEALESLAENIRQKGLLQPIVVREKKESGQYELIAGERRLRACMHLKAPNILAKVIVANDANSALIALIENLQRENLNPLEEAYGYAAVLKDFGMTQSTLSKELGRARTTIANALRLTQLEAEIQGYIRKGLLSSGHAKALLMIEDSIKRCLLARKVVELGLSVRDTENMAAQTKEQRSASSALAPVNSSVRNAVVESLQKDISIHLSTAVQIKHGPKKGKLIINYHGNDDLQRILSRMGIGSEQSSSKSEVLALS